MLPERDAPQQAGGLERGEGVVGRRRLGIGEPASA